MNLEDVKAEMARSELSMLLKKLGKKYALEFDSLEIDDRKLEILNICDMRSHLDQLLASHSIQDPLRDLPLWAKVWPSAFILGRFLRKMRPEGKSLLELGAGMGILSLVASAYGFRRIVLSEANAEALDFARANVLKNNLENLVQTTLLEIGVPTGAVADEKFDMIAASELLYLDGLHRPLLKFLQKHLAPGGQAIFCTDAARLKPEFKKRALADFKVQEGHIGVKAEEEGEMKQRVYNILILEGKCC